MPRGRSVRPKNVRRPYKPNKSASDSGDAESLSALRGRLRGSRDAPPAGASAAPSTTERESSAAPREGSHSERPPGTSSPVEVPDPSVDFELTLPSALMDSHEDGSWDPAGDVGTGAAGGSGPPVAAGGSGPPVDAGGSLPPPAPSSASRPASPVAARAAAFCCSSWDAACATEPTGCSTFCSAFGSASGASSAGSFGVGCRVSGHAGCETDRGSTARTQDSC